MTTDVIEGEVIGRELVPQQTVSLAVSVDEAIQQWNDYQELTRRLLNETDYQKIGNRQFKKKSAWRKYARAFNITDRVTYEEISRDATGFPCWARIRVEARATNGRTAEADHECHVSERCCVQPCPKRNWNNHSCCKADCDGKKHWSHPGDLPATALTRAKNRAISDLIGAGEVSAEEMEPEREAPKVAVAPKPATNGERKTANWTPFWKRMGELKVTKLRALEIIGVSDAAQLVELGETQEDIEKLIACVEEHLSPAQAAIEPDELPFK